MLLISKHSRSPEFYVKTHPIYLMHISISNKMTESARTEAAFKNPNPKPFFHTHSTCDNPNE